MPETITIKDILKDMLDTPEGTVALAAVKLANTLPHFATGESKRMFAQQCIAEANPSLSRSEAFYLIELAVKYLKEGSNGN